MNGVWSQFAEEEMFNNIPYEDRPTRHLKAITVAKNTSTCLRTQARQTT